MTALVVAEHDHTSLKGVTLQAVTAARACASDVHVLVAGFECGEAAAQAARIAGVSKVLLAEGEVHREQLSEPLAEQVRALSGAYGHIVLAATARGRSVAPRVAALLDVAQISDVTRVDAADTFERPIYAGNAIARVQSIDEVKVITVRSTGFEAAPPSSSPASVEPVSVVADTGVCRLVGREIARSERPELGEARVVVSGGRALGSRERFDEVLLPLADRLGAALGASRAAVDAGYAPNDWQVGQTGKIVAPQLYVAVGISGAIQHLAGMKDSKLIVAINTDPEAPIFGVADYGLVADLFEAVPELTSSL